VARRIVDAARTASAARRGLDDSAELAGTSGARAWAARRPAPGRGV